MGKRRSPNTHPAFADVRVGDRVRIQMTDTAGLDVVITGPVTEVTYGGITIGNQPLATNLSVFEEAGASVTVTVSERSEVPL